MKKILSIFAAALVAIAVNAEVINITNEIPDALRIALHSASDGDEIVMAAGTYVESNDNYITFDGKEVTVMAAEGAEVIIQPQVPITVSNGGHAIFENVKIDASRLQELATWYEHLLYVNDANPNGFTFRGCEIYGYAVNNSMFYCNSTNELAMAKFENCYFHDIMKSIIFVENTESEPMVSVKNCTFANISTNAESYWAGVIDVRATEATLTVDHCTFYNVIPMNTDYSCVSKITLAQGNVSNCIFMLPTAQDGIRAMRGVTATNCITFNYLKDSGTGIHSSVTQNNCVQVDPAFVDPDNNNFTLGESSPALTMNDGEPIGDPRWVPSAEPELENGYYLVGTMNNWQVEAEYKLVLNEQADDTEYMYDITFAEEDRFKVVDYQNGNLTWHPGEGDGYVIDADHVGEATVYFRPNGKQGDESWYYTIIYVAVHEDPQPAEAQLWKATAETPTTAGSTLIDDDLLTLASVYESFVSGTNHTYGEEVFAKAFQVRAKNAPTEDNLTGEENETTDDTKKASPLVLTAKEDIEVTFYYRQQQTAETPAAENDNKDLWIYDQAAITAKLTGTHTSVDVSADSKYAFVTKKMTFTKNHVYTLTAVGTTLPLFGLEYKATEGEGETTALTNTEASAKAVKKMVNGILIIEKAGVKYNVLGTAL